MTRWLSMVLVLVVGAVLGYAIRDIPVNVVTETIFGGTETEQLQPVNHSTDRDEESDPERSEASNDPEIQPFPVADRIITSMLPGMCLTRVRVNVAEIRNSTAEQGLSMFLFEPAVQDMLIAMSENASPSFGPFLGTLAGQAERMDLFLLPPPDDFPIPVILLTADWPEVDYADLRESLREPIAAELPEGEEYSQSVEQFTVEGVRAPNGNISYVVTENRVWICNNQEQLQKLLTTDIPPSETESRETTSIDRVPDGPVVAVLNLEPEPAGKATPAGPLAFLSDMGLRSVTVGWGAAPGSLVAFGEFKETPEWAEDWPVIEGNASLTPGTLAILESTLPPLPSPRFTGRSPSGRSPFGDRRAMERRRDHPSEPPEETSGRRRGGFRPRGGRPGAPVLGMLTRFLPPAKSIAVRLADGEEEQVVWSVYFREGEDGRLAEWLEFLANSPWSESQELDTGLHEVTFQGGPLMNAYGVNRLLYAQRDGGLTFYSSEEAARSLGAPAGSTGGIVMESNEEATTRPQIQAAISREFLSMLIHSERNSINPDSSNAEIIREFFDVLGQYVSPLKTELALVENGIRIEFKGENQLAPVIGPVFVTSAFFRGGF